MHINLAQFPVSTEKRIFHKSSLPMQFAVITETEEFPNFPLSKSLIKKNIWHNSSSAMSPALPLFLIFIHSTFLVRYRYSNMYSMWPISVFKFNFLASYFMYILSLAQSPAKSRQRQRRRQGAADPAAPAPAQRLSVWGAQSFPSRATGSAGSLSTTAGLVFARLALTDRSSAGQHFFLSSKGLSYEID